MNQRGEILVEGVIVVTLVIFLSGMMIEKMISIQERSYNYFENSKVDYSDQLLKLVKELRIEKASSDGK